MGSKQNENTSPSEITSFEKLNWLIHLHHVRKEIGPCKELIKSELKRSAGQNEYVYFKQGEILKSEGKIQEALEAFQICIKLNASNPDYIKEVASCLYEMHRFRLALEAYLEADRIVTSSKWEIYYNIGQCYLRLGDIPKAKENAYHAVQLGKHEMAYSLLIKILVFDGDIKAASTVSDSAVESCADSVPMLCESGLLHLKLRQTQLAFERFSSALALDPANAKALLGIGCITQSYGEHDVALTKYKFAVANEPNSVALWNNIGVCFYSNQKFIAAISCLKRALWLAPLNWRVLFNLGLVHLSTRQFASAFNFLCAAVNLRPDAAQTFIGLGYTLFHLKDSENALRSFQQALVFAPDDPTSVVNTLVTLANIKKFDETITNLCRKFKELLDQKVPMDQEVMEMGEYVSTILEDELSKSKNKSACQEVNMENTASHVTPDENSKGNHESTDEAEADKITSDGDLKSYLLERKFEPDEV